MGPVQFSDPAEWPTFSLLSAPKLGAKFYTPPPPTPGKTLLGVGGRIKEGGWFKIPAAGGFQIYTPNSCRGRLPNIPLPPPPKNLLTPLFLRTGCFPGDFQERKRPIEAFGETAH